MTTSTQTDIREFLDISDKKKLVAMRREGWAIEEHLPTSLANSSYRIADLSWEAKTWQPAQVRMARIVVDRVSLLFEYLLLKHEEVLIQLFVLRSSAGRIAWLVEYPFIEPYPVLNILFIVLNLAHRDNLDCLQVIHLVGLLSIDISHPASR